MNRTFGCIALVLSVSSTFLKGGESTTEILRKVQTLNGVAKSTPLSVHYILDEKFCCRCLAGELETGWVPTEYFKSGWLKLYSWVIDSSGTLVQSSCSMNKAIKPVDSASFLNASSLRPYCGKAIISSENGEIIATYKIAGNDQIRACKIVDSMYSTQQVDSLASSLYTIIETDTISIPYKPGNTPYFVPSFVDLKPLVFVPSQSSVGIFSSKSDTYSWVRLIPRAQTFIDQKLPVRDMFNLRQVTDSSFIGLSIEHFAPVDTVIQNERAVFYSKRREALDLFILHKDTVVSRRLLSLKLQSIDSIVPTVAGSTTYGIQRIAAGDSVRLVYFSMYDTLLNVVPDWKIKSSEVRSVYGIDSSVAVLNTHGSVQVFDAKGLKYQFQTIDLPAGVSLSPRISRLLSNTCGFNYSDDGKQAVELIDDLGMRRSAKVLSASNQYVLIGNDGTLASFQREYDKNGLNIIIAKSHKRQVK
ncbi:hypothetical protein BH10BAC6_BH10BAC6_18760 [soil metagenome]